MRLVTFLADVNPEMAAALDGIDGLESVLAGTEDEFCAAVADADAACVYNGAYSRAMAAAVAGAPRLRWIQTGSTGCDRLFEFGLADGIRVSTAGGLWAGAVADHAVALLLAVLRQLPLAEAQKRDGAWNRQAIRPRVRAVGGLRVAIIGFGAIGRQIGGRLRAFEAVVTAAVRDPARLGAEVRASADEVVTVDALRRRLDRFDVVMPAVPLDASTHRLVDAGFLAAMRPGAILVNITRGGVVDEAALVAALAGGRLGGAGLDVFGTEPLPPDSPLWRLDNVVLTPHVAGFGDPRHPALLAALVARNVRACMAGRDLENEVPRRPDRETATAQAEALP
jgi:phosphoglycerate dehydrogenase-like enzyme